MSTPIVLLPSLGKTSVGSLGVGMCRFCGSTDNTGILAIGNVCAEPECQVEFVKSKYNILQTCVFFV